MQGSWGLWELDDACYLSDADRCYRVVEPGKFVNHHAGMGNDGPHELCYKVLYCNVGYLAAAVPNCYRITILRFNRTQRYGSTQGNGTGRNKVSS